MASKMSAEIPSAKHAFFWSKNIMETKLIAICCPLTTFAQKFYLPIILAGYSFEHVNEATDNVLALDIDLD